jgi:hypothetical protein
VGSRRRERARQARLTWTRGKEGHAAATTIVSSAKISC